MATCRRHREGGFTYFGLLLVVALGGTVLATAGTVWSTQARRDKEAELLFAGSQIRSAIAQFHEQAPAGQPHRFPRNFDELLDDKRWPTRRRHLRRVFAEPMAADGEWVLVRAPDGGVIGVHSASALAPLKRAHFAAEDKVFEDASSYRDWRFVYVPGGAAQASN